MNKLFKRKEKNISKYDKEKPNAKRIIKVIKETI